MEKKLRVFEAFAGVGSQRMALRNLGIDHEVVGIAEIDKFALKSYEAIHGDCPNYGDISKLNPSDLPDMDLFTYSFPCQDLSVAGKQKGLGEGTRSGLLYECEKVIEAKRPKYLLLENVKNLVGKKFKADFDKWLEYLEELGYSNYWKVLNAKDYGVPQNRERVFVISILDDKKGYEFPKPIKLDKAIKDILEDEVEERYYFKDKKFKLVEDGDIVNNKNSIALFVDGKFKHNKTIQDISKECPCLSARDYKHPQRILVESNAAKLGKLIGKAMKSDKECCDSTLMKPKVIDVANCITSRYDAGIQNKQSIGVAVVEKVLIPQATKKGYIEMELGGVCDLTYPNSKTRRGRVQENGNMCPTLTASTQDIVRIEYNNKQVELPCICASRGRNPINPSDRTIGAYTEQRLEINTNGTSNTVTTVQKDNYAIEESFRVRKLTPLECWRLMSFSDEDFYKAKSVGISNSQLYKQAGNSIVVKVLEGIFKNMFLCDPRKCNDVECVNVKLGTEEVEQFKWCI